MKNKFAYAIGQEVFYKGVLRKIEDRDSYRVNDANPHHRNSDWNEYWFEGFEASPIGDISFLAWEWELDAENIL